VNSMKTLPSELVIRITKQYFFLRYFAQPEVMKSISEAIFPDENVVMSSAFNRPDLSTVDVMLKLQDGAVLKVHWKPLFKASDGKEGIEGHTERYHAACDGKGATMTLVKVQGSNGEEMMAAGYRPGWHEPGYHPPTLNPDGFIVSINTTAQTLNEVKYSGNETIVYDRPRHGPWFLKPLLLIGWKNDPDVVVSYNIFGTDKTNKLLDYEVFGISYTMGDIEDEEKTEERRATDLGE
jgi:hypothetical protein